MKFRVSAERTMSLSVALVWAPTKNIKISVLHQISLWRSWHPQSPRIKLDWLVILDSMQIQLLAFLTFSGISETLKIVVCFIAYDHVIFLKKHYSRGLTVLQFNKNLNKVFSFFSDWWLFKTSLFLYDTEGFVSCNIKCQVYM